MTDAINGRGVAARVTAALKAEAELRGVGQQTDDRKERDLIIAMLYKFARQRPGLEFGNYGDVAAYRKEMREITRDLGHAQRMLRRIELSSITAAELKQAFRAYSGRLTLEKRADGKLVMDYCTGQYWPTEYRRAVCAVAASALWYYKRDHCMPAPEPTHQGEWLHKQFRREFGRGIANRWFN